MQISLPLRVLPLHQEGELSCPRGLRFPQETKGWSMGVAPKGKQIKKESFGSLFSYSFRGLQWVIVTRSIYLPPPSGTPSSSRGRVLTPRGLRSRSDCNWFNVVSLVSFPYYHHFCTLHNALIICKIIETQTEALYNPNRVTLPSIVRKGYDTNGSTIQPQRGDITQHNPDGLCRNAATITPWINREEKNFSVNFVFCEVCSIFATC